MVELLSPSDFCRTYAVGRSTLYRLLAKPDNPLRLIKIGRASRISRADAEAWLASLQSKGA